jgi:hypothetical protein
MSGGDEAAKSASEASLPVLSTDPNSQAPEREIGPESPEREVTTPVGETKTVPRLKMVVIAVAAGVFCVALGATAAHALRKAPVFGKQFWNFDEASMPDGTAREGWSGNETDATGLTYRWCAARTCGLSLTVGDDVARWDGEILLRARMWAHRYPGVDRPQTVRLVVNTEVMGEHTLGDGISTESFRVRPGALVPGSNDVAFEFAYTKAPKEYGANEDARQLSAAVDWIEIEPIQ